MGEKRRRKKERKNTGGKKQFYSKQKLTFHASLQNKIKIRQRGKQNRKKGG
jgi:hypothetical protein